MMEKDWLDSEKIKHEVVYVDANQEEGMKMVRKTGQMGVPVTEITYENGKEEFVIGFDKQRLSQILNA
jgi:glutaredoxin